MAIQRPGIRITSSAIRAYVKVGSHQVQRSFAPDTNMADVAAWREQTRQELALRHGGGPDTLASDIGTYLSGQSKSRRRSAEGWLRKWASRFGARRRTSLTYEELRDALMDWRSEGYAASSLNKLRGYLIAVWRYCDGSSARCPVRSIPKFPEPVPTPRAVDHELWDKAFAAMRDTCSKARLLMMRHTGARPTEIAMLTPEDLHLEDAVPWVYFRTGKGGNNRVVPLNTKGSAAARLFVTTGAFGSFSTGSLRKVLLRACAAAGMTDAELIAGATPLGRKRWRLHPYVARHQCLTELRRAGADLADVQAIAGHRNQTTTARYAPVVLEKLAAAMKRLEGSPD